MISTVRRRLASLAAVSVLGVGALAGCTAATADSDTSPTTDSASVSATQTPAAVLAANTEAHSVDATDYDASTATTITLEGDSATVSGEGSDSVTVDGSTVTITVEGSYLLSGSRTDGQVIIDAAGAHVTLVLDGVDIAAAAARRSRPPTSTRSP